MSRFGTDLHDTTLPFCFPNPLLTSLVTLPPRNLDELCDWRGELTSEVKCYDQFVDGHESVDASARELCRGVYLLIISENMIRTRNRGRRSSR